MSLTTVGSFAIALYLYAFVYQILQLRNYAARNSNAIIAISASAIACNALLSWQLILSESGFDFSLWRISTAILCIVNLVVVFSSLRKTALNLTLFLYPLTIPTIFFALSTDSTTAPLTHMTYGIGLHILCSILAYSLLLIAALQASILAYQNWLLRHKHLNGFIKALPPLETMETLLFDILWVGIAFLSASLISGLFVFDDIFAQHLAHKTVFSISAWLIYATLLWGRHQRGWRGNMAIRWTIGGFITTLLAYWGSKFVLEILL